MENVLAILLAGGTGERLYPLTRDTAKPAVPFGGAYRIVDFTLSNCINSNVRRILILTQYKSLGLIRHIRDGLSPGVRVNSYCEIEYSILMPNAETGRYSRVSRAIINTGVKVPESSVIGFDPEADRAKGYHVTEGGIAVVA